MDAKLGVFKHEWRIPKSETVGFVYTGLAMVALSPAILLIPVQFPLRVLGGVLVAFFGALVVLLGYVALCRAKRVLRIHENGFASEYEGQAEGVFLYQDLESISLANKIKAPSMQRLLRLRMTFPGGKGITLHHNGTQGVSRERINAIWYIAEQARRAGKTIRKDLWLW